MSRWALITGASGGIGQATAKKLAQEGCHLMLHYHQNEQAASRLSADLKETYQVETHVVQADLAKTGGAAELVSRLPLDPDILVLNSGKSHVGLVTDTEKEDLASMVQLHVTSPYELTQSILPAMIQKSQVILLRLAQYGGKRVPRVKYCTVWSRVLKMLSLKGLPKSLPQVELEQMQSHQVRFRLI